MLYTVCSSGGKVGYCEVSLSSKLVFLLCACGYKYREENGI